MSNLSCSVLFCRKLVFFQQPMSSPPNIVQHNKIKNGLHFRLQKYTFGQILFRKYTFVEVILGDIKNRWVEKEAPL